MAGDFASPPSVMWLPKAQGLHLETASLVLAGAALAMSTPAQCSVTEGGLQDT